MNYTEMVEQLLLADEDWSSSGPQDQNKIDEIEKLHSMKLPNSICEFIRQVGTIEFPNHDYIGIDDAYLHDEYGFMANTKMLQTNHDLPDGWLALEYDHDADVIACIELADDASVEPTVQWYHVFEKKFVGKCADNFYEFIRERIESWL